MAAMAAMPWGELEGDSQRSQVWMPAASSAEVGVFGMDVPCDVSRNERLKKIAY